MSDEKPEWAGTTKLFPVRPQRGWWFEERFIYADIAPRDYFAAHALVMFSDQSVLTSVNEQAQRDNTTPFSIMASAAYELADAMVKARDAK